MSPSHGHGRTHANSSSLRGPSNKIQRCLPVTPSRSVSNAMQAIRRSVTGDAAIALQAVGLAAEFNDQEETTMASAWGKGNYAGQPGDPLPNLKKMNPQQKRRRRCDGSPAHGKSKPQRWSGCPLWRPFFTRPGDYGDNRRCAARGGGLEDEALGVLQHVEPACAIAGVIRADLRRHVEIGAEKRRCQFGNQLLLGIAFAPQHLRPKLRSRRDGWRVQCVASWPSVA